MSNNPRGALSYDLVTRNRDGLILGRPVPDIVVYDRVGSFAGVTVGRVAQGGQVGVQPLALVILKIFLLKIFFKIALYLVVLLN